MQVFWKSVPHAFQAKPSLLMVNTAIFSLEGLEKASFPPKFFHKFVWYAQAFTFGNVKLTYLEGRRVKTTLTRQKNAIFLKKCPPCISSQSKPSHAVLSLKVDSESNFCPKIEFWILVRCMFPHVPKHKTSWFWASETIGTNRTSKKWNFFKFLWLMDFFMISWKYACFPCYFWEDQNLSLSVSVENYSYIHFLASNKSKLLTCYSRELIRALTISKKAFWTRCWHILAYFYKPYFLENAKNMPSDFVEYSTSPVEISGLPTKIFEFSKLRRWL